MEAIGLVNEYIGIENDYDFNSIVPLEIIYSHLIASEDPSELRDILFFIQ